MTFLKIAQILLNFQGSAGPQPQSLSTMPLLATFTYYITYYKIVKRVAKKKLKPHNPYPAKLLPKTDPQINLCNTPKNPLCPLCVPLRPLCDQNPITKQTPFSPAQPAHKPPQSPTPTYPTESGANPYKHFPPTTSHS